MNKKFSTLMASLLLAGGVLSSANAAISATAQAAAAELTANEQWVVDYGKYFVLERLNFHDKSTGSWSANADYYLTMNNNGQLVYTNNPSFEDKDAYWTIEDVTTTNDPQITSQYVAKVKVVNANGWTLAFDKTSVTTDGHLKMATDATAAEDRIDEFYVETKQSTNNGLLCLWVNGQKYLLGNGDQIATGIYEAVAVNDAASAGTINDVNAVGINEEAITAADLNAEWNGGFYLNFSSKGKEYKNLTGAEPFAGKLTAIGVNDDDVNYSSDTQFYLRTANGDYVVLSDDYIGDADATLNGTKSAFYRGYNFKTISEHAFNQLSNKTVAQFSIFKSYDFNKDNIRTDSLIVSLPNVKAIGSVPNAGLNMSAANHESGLRLFVSTVNVAGVTSNLLTTIDYTKCNDMLADVKDNAYATAQMGALAPCIKLGVSNMIDMTAFAGKIWNITDKDGNVLSPKYNVADIDSYAELFAPANQVDLTNPEGQWLLYKDNYGYYYFVNRESGQKAFGSGFTIRTTDANDKYELYWDKYSSNEEYTIYIREAKDAVLGKKSEKGYVNFDMTQEDNNGKYLSFETSLGVTAYIGKDADDNVILTDDASKAIEFRVKQLSHDFSDHDGIAAPDTLHHYTSYLNKDLKQAVDTLQFFHYALYENFSEKYLKYDRENKKFILSDEDSDFSPLNAHEKFAEEYRDYTFVVKEKEDGSYILVREYAIDYDYCTGAPNHTVYKDWDNKDYTFDNTFEVNFGNNAYDQNEDYNVSRSDYYNANGNAHKAYAATQPGTLADMASLYNYNDNDRITMEATNKVEYMTITGSQDTVKISLKAQPNFFLYEDGTFLGMEHVADKDMKPAMFVDTAYVRNNTYRPQYLLAMNGKHVEPVWDNNPSHTIPHLLAPDTTYGRFLINAVDSANAWTGTVKTNPYIHEQLGNNYYYRLVFVDGYHTGDKLFLNTANAKTTIDLGNNNDKVCTFAFRYVDESREGVKIETLYGVKADGTPVRGWLKYQNNVPVVTNDYEDAHVFTVDNTTTDAPTANEEISAGNVVVAGVNGAVVVKGAEGKNVIVSTILGKVVANEVLTSDNAQIAAPAGIVVVSVDGESFKVVVK